MNTNKAWRTAQREKREDAAIHAMHWLLTALLYGTLLALLLIPGKARAEDMQALAHETAERMQQTHPHLSPLPEGEDVKSQSSPATGEDKKSWTGGDTALQAAFLTALAIDRGQTVELRDRHLEEIGWARSFIGAHPSSGQVNRYFATCALAHTAIAYVLHKPYRTIWQSFWIGVEVDTIHSNSVNMGISVRF